MISPGCLVGVAHFAAAIQATELFVTLATLSNRAESLPQTMGHWPSAYQDQETLQINSIIDSFSITNGNSIYFALGDFTIVRSNIVLS